MRAGQVAGNGGALGPPRVLLLTASDQGQRSEPASCRQEPSENCCEHSMRCFLGAASEERHGRMHRDGVLSRRAAGGGSKVSHPHVGGTRATPSARGLERFTPRRSEPSAPLRRATLGHCTFFFCWHEASQAWGSRTRHGRQARGSRTRRGCFGGPRGPCGRARCARGCPSS